MNADVEEDIPPNAPQLRGRPIQINCFVDSDHAANRMTRWSHAGILLYCNSAPVLWYSKKNIPPSKVLHLGLNLLLCM